MWNDLIIDWNDLTMERNGNRLKGSYPSSKESKRQFEANLDFPMMKCHFRFPLPCCDSLHARGMQDGVREKKEVGPIASRPSQGTVCAVHCVERNLTILCKTALKARWKYTNKEMS